MTPDALDDELRRELLAYVDDCARDFRGRAARVTLTSTVVHRLTALTGSGKPGDSTQVWVLAAEAGPDPFVHPRLGPEHLHRGLLLVLRRSDLGLLQRAVAPAPFDLSSLGPGEVLRDAV